MDMLTEVKAYLKITWESENSDLEGYVLRGKSLLDSLTGTANKYEEEGLAKSLLLDYVRYAYNNGIEYFQDNFAKEILHLQIMEGINAMGGDEDVSV